MSSKFTRRPKTPAASDAHDFIEGAERRESNDMKSYHAISYDTVGLPWQDPKVRDDVLKVYNLRLPEPYLLKLKYIAEHTSGSMHSFCLDALLPAIDAKIAALAKQ